MGINILLHKVILNSNIIEVKIQTLTHWKLSLATFRCKRYASIIAFYVYLHKMLHGICSVLFTSDKNYRQYSCRALHNYARDLSQHCIEQNFKRVHLSVCAKTAQSYGGVRKP